MGETIINFPPFGIVKLLFQVKRLLKIGYFALWNYLCEWNISLLLLHRSESYISFTTTLKGAKQIPIGNKLYANENMQLQVLLY